jgi:precorrin-2 dehydrogenase/sirohydrochlorin ferrochelatase
MPGRWGRQDWRIEDSQFARRSGSGSGYCAKSDSDRISLEDLNSIFLVVGATSSIEVNDAVYREAQARHILCNIVDDPERCDFYYPSVVRRGDLQVAISTAGHSPALAQRLRREFEAQLAPVYAGWLEELGRTRKKLFARSIEPERRRTMLHSAASRQSFEARQSVRERNEKDSLEVAHER